MPGSLASAWAYRREIRASAGLARLLVPPAVVGSIAGALLLNVTPVRVFDRLVPWLVLGATLLILFQGRVASVSPRRRLERRKACAPGARGRQLPARGRRVRGVLRRGDGHRDARFSFARRAEDIHHKNALKNLLAVAINGVASIYFVAAGLVSDERPRSWSSVPPRVATAGGQLGRRVPARVVRAMVVRSVSDWSALLAYRAWGFP